jgi:hypothetical protein
MSQGIGQKNRYHTIKNLDGGKDSSSTITISMKDKDDHGEPESEDDKGDNDTTSSQDEKSLAADKPPKKKKKKSKWKQPKTIKEKLHWNPVSRCGRMGKEKSRGLIDPGTEINVIGGPGWHVLSKIDNMNAQLDGALTGMGKCSLPLVCAVTAYIHRLLGTVLL